MEDGERRRNGKWEEKKKDKVEERKWGEKKKDKMEERKIMGTCCHHGFSSLRSVLHF